MSFQRVAIIGLGLLGGSIGLAVRAHLPSVATTGFDANAAARVRASERGLVGTDEYEHTGLLRFFNNEHLDNWRIGDILCEIFKEESFLPLREKYLELKSQLKELYDAADYYRRKINRLKLLKDRYCYTNGQEH